MKVAVIEPYYGGSHKAFLDQLSRLLPFEFSFHTLPARKWKWRMRLAAPFFAEHFQRHPKDHADVSAILCSPFLDVATFKGMVPDSLKNTPVYTYFHENQFAYPVQYEDERDLHFALTNLTTAMASDSLAFNSGYNLHSFLQGAGSLLKMICDMRLQDYQQAILEKSVVLYPGIDFTSLDRIAHRQITTAPVIVWNHRWEHDKNPELFFETMCNLDKKGLNFKLVVLGEAFQQQPAVFREAERALKHRIIHFGYIESREQYLQCLKSSDIVLSTSNHEFYGISVIEAVRAGCRPLLPARLSYPELFPPEYLYQDQNLEEQLTDLLLHYKFSAEEGKRLTQQFSWETLREKYKRWLTDDRL